MKDTSSLIALILAPIVAAACLCLFILTPCPAHGDECGVEVKELVIHDCGRLARVEVTLENYLPRGVETVIAIIRYRDPLFTIDEDAKLLGDSGWGSTAIEPFSTADFTFTSPIPKVCTEIHIFLKSVYVTGRGWIECH